MEKRVFEKIIYALDKETGTSVIGKRLLLKRWLNEFQNLDNDEIMKRLNEEFSKSDSVLKKHSSHLSSIYKNPTTYNFISDLIKERTRILEGKYTKQPIFTGRRVVT